MAIFQNSVVKRFLDNLESSVIDSAYERYKEVYSVRRIHEIKKLKEEQYQEGFIKDIFGKVLGYTIPPESPINIELEKKNETDAKKADGAIIKDGKVIGVIELKDNKTKNLDKVKDQAFGYKNNHKGCKYVISSNFQKLRFYIDDATEYEEFDLYNLDKEQFSRFYLFLSKERLLDNDTPEKIKKETKFHEEEIGNQLYKDYSTFKNKFFNNIVSNNPQYDKLLLFKKSQKFLDRILFILFAEDKRLIPENAIIRIVESWEKADDLHYKPLYELFNILFTHLNEGFTYKSGYEIPAYNGGLFAKDEVLDNIKVDDGVLKDDLLILSKYDFNTEVDVNILGHIFEHSLTELEQIEAEIKGEIADNKKGKRKKDGVFYTPKYITKYIVDNTIGKLCDDKRKELKIDDFDVNEYQNKNGKLNTKGKALFNVLENYKEWLFELKIVDPACGSGAFLNQALTYLMDEHKFVDDLIAELTNTPLRLFDTDKAILEKNIYGVDINEESVDIAKLSLWLRTAQKGRKLSNLSNNIKCGNSLISDVEVARDKAFTWEKQFPEVFDNGGFDVVIGNPPYVFGGNKGISSNEKKYFKKHYKTGGGKVNLFTLFIELSHSILRVNGEFSFIIPNTFLRVTSYDESRRFFLDNFKFRELGDLGNDVFQGAVTSAIILVATKEERIGGNSFNVFKDFSGKYNAIELDDIVQNGYIITSNLTKEKTRILKNIRKKSTLLGDECREMIFGVVITKNKDEIVSSTPIENYKPFLEGKDIGRYLIKPIHQYLNYNPKLLHRARSKEVFESNEKLLVQRITGGKKPLKVAYDNNRYYNKESLNNIILKDESKFSARFIICLLNSSLINWYYNNQFTNGSTLTVNISKEYLSKIPIAKTNSQNNFIKKADKMIQNTETLFSYSKKFCRYIESNFDSISCSNKIIMFYELEFIEFIKELNKGIRKSGGEKLSKLQEMEWIEVFETKKKEAQQLKEEIDKTDREIDQMVYELYGLTEDEIKIVEES
jgi:type I restriction-modification system DNA methylase subunit